MLADRWKKKINVVIVILALLALGVYGYFQAQDLIIGPVVEIKYPKKNQLIEGEMVIAKGSTRNVSKIELNGQSIFITPEGEFAEKLPLLGAHTIIQVEAWDRFGRSTLVRREVIRESGDTEMLTQEDLERRVSGEDAQDEDGEDISPENNPFDPENN